MMYWFTVIITQPGRKKANIQRCLTLSLNFDKIYLVIPKSDDSAESKTEISTMDKHMYQLRAKSEKCGGQFHHYLGDLSWNRPYTDDDLRCFVLRNVCVKDCLHDVAPIGPCQFDAAFQTIFGGAAYEPRIHSSSPDNGKKRYIGDFTITLVYHSSISYSTNKTINVNRKKPILSIRVNILTN